MTKSLPASTSLSMAAFSQKSVDIRFDRWTKRIDEWKGDRQRAQELYRGGHSSVVRNLAKSQSIDELRCFVVSAGYGLVSLDAELAPYAATFAPGHVDSVARCGGKDAPVENMGWWKRLTGWKPKGVVGVRSIASAVKKWPECVHLFALSPSYLDAISADLADARKNLPNHENLIVISTGKKRHGALNGNVIRAPAVLQPNLGGALVSLGVRLAVEILNSIPTADLSLQSVRQHIELLQTLAPPRHIPTRQRVSDVEAIRFIRKYAKSTGSSSYSNALDSLRAAGFACEMRRFRGLFRKTVTA